MPDYDEEYDDQGYEEEYDAPVRRGRRENKHSGLKALYEKAPWFVIAFSFTVTLLGATAIVKFAQHKAEQKKIKAMQAEVARSTEDLTPVEEEQEIEIEPIPLTEPEDDDSEPLDHAEPEIYMPDAMISDHNETADDEDFEQMKGETLDPNQNMFDSIGLGAGSGVGKGRYGGSFGGRRRLVARRGRPGGATKRTQTAVLNGLKWLARHQHPDGSWSPAEFSNNCGGNKCEGAGYANYDVGVTGLSLLAYLGAGYTHLSRDSWIDPVNKKRYIMGKIIKDGLRWLIEQQHEDGAIGQIVGEFFYNHCIATLALTEGYGLTQNSLLKEPAQRALDYMMRYQTPAPGGTGFYGWRYLPEDGISDTSVTGWAVMALKSAELSRLKISRTSMDGALNFVRSVTKSNGLTGYLSVDDAGQQPIAPGLNDDYANHKACMTSVGMLIRTFVEHDLNDPFLQKGADLILEDLPIWNQAEKNNDYYYWYYASLALYQFDGPDSPRNDGSYWKRWNTELVKALVPNQHKDACLLGSWDSDDRWGYAGGRIYSTAINTLTLEVYYRYGNAFGIGKRGASTKSKE